MYIGIIILCILLFFISTMYKESFNACTGTDCISCSKQSGCSWCDKAKKCVDSTTLKSTDSQCNPTNAISSSFSCPSVMNASYKGTANNPINETLYHDQIAEKVKPPNIGLNDTMQYTPETVMANINEVRQTIQEYNNRLPDTISSSIENSIQPMVKVMLSSTYQRECS